MMYEVLTAKSKSVVGRSQTTVPVAPASIAVDTVSGYQVDPEVLNRTETVSIVAATLPVFLTVQVISLAVRFHVTESIRTWVCACCDWEPIIDITQEYVITEAATAIAMSNRVAIKGLMALAFFRNFWIVF
jgi:hypothetical protein